MAKTTSKAKHLLYPTAAIQQLENSMLQVLDKNIPVDHSFLPFLLTKPGSKIDHLPGLYCSVLASVFLENRLRGHSLLSENDLKVFTELKEWHITLLKSRFDEVSGLLYLLDPKESVLSKASYWTDSEDNKLAEPAFLSLIIWSLELLILLGGHFKQDVSILSEYLEVLVYSMNEQLWDEEYGIYFPKNLSTNQLILTDSIGGLLPLLADIPSQDQAEAMYRTLSSNFVQGKHFYFPTECVVDGMENRMIDPIINYLLFFGLIRFEFSATAKALKQHTEYLVEYYGYQRSYDSKRDYNKNLKTTTPVNSIQLLFQHLFEAEEYHYTNLM